MKSFLFLLLLIMASCAKAPKVPPSLPPPPLPFPQLNKTFGEVKFSGVATLLLHYKSITILVDPGLAASSVPSLDYLILTDTAPHHFNLRGADVFRRDIKILAPAQAVSSLNQAGFSQVRGVGPGQRVLLKKSDAFLFLSCCSSRNLVSGAQVNGYLLEFDNGRNLFISGETVDEAVFRSFVYDLRDDGKEIHLAFFYGGGLRSAESGALESLDEEKLPSAISLLQPKIAYILQANGLDAAATNEKRLNERLKEEIYDGGLAIPKPGQVFPF